MALTKNIEAASRSATSKVTRDLRTYLIESGWSAEAASAVSVIYTETDGFSVKITGQHKQTAETLEYGNESMRPTAAIRKYFNDRSSFEHHYKKALEVALGVKL